MGHAARAFLPSGQVFASRRVTFFLRAQKKSNQKKTAPCGAFRITSDPLRCFPQLACIGGGRGSSVLKREALQPCHLKPPQNIRLTRNPLGAFLLRAHQRGSRNVVQNSERVSTALCIQPRVFDTRLSNTRVPTLHYLMSIRELTERKAKLTLQRHYIAAC